jgi:hypothetical protein
MNHNKTNETHHTTVIRIAEHAWFDRLVASRADLQLARLVGAHVHVIQQRPDPEEIRLRRPG